MALRGGIKVEVRWKMNGGPLTADEMLMRLTPRGSGTTTTWRIILPDGKDPKAREAADRRVDEVLEQMERIAPSILEERVYYSRLYDPVVSSPSLEARHYCDVLLTWLYGRPAAYSLTCPEPIASCP